MKGGVALRRYAFLLLLLFLTVTVISCVKKPEPEPLPPLIGEVTELADQFMALLLAGDYAGATDYFDATYKKEMPTEKLAAAWLALLEEAGEYRGEIGKQVESEPDYEIVILIAEFENTMLDIQLKFNSDNRIVGLLF